MTKLNADNLSSLAGQVRIPSYPRSGLKTGIVHIGTGNFYRGHMALFTDEILGQGNTDWGICAVGIREADSRMHGVLTSQDGLYTLMVREANGALTARIIGSVTENRFGPPNPMAVVEKMAHPEVRIISLTITEGGYNFDANTGSFLLSAPDVRWDLHHPDRPRTVYGYLARSLKLRRDRDLAGITLLSCDNIPHNGDTLRRMLLAFLEEADPGLLGWTAGRVAFPNGMVDRITPVTAREDIDLLRTRYRVDDAWPVVCEPFIQWVVEDRFANGRPQWESAGVQFVSDVAPYEKMKIRLLNAGHSLLGILGSLLGYQNIDEAVRDPLLESTLRMFMDEEVSPTLGEMPGIDLKKYKESLIRRFANPYLKDPLTRICSDSSAKIPKFLLPAQTEQLEAGGPIGIGTLILAAWCHYLEMAGRPGYPYEINDDMKDILRQRAIESVSGDPLAFIRLENVFGKLSQSPRFRKTYLSLIRSLRKNGPGKLLRQILNSREI